MAKRVVDVLVPVALDRAYSYRVPENLTLAPGDIVCVPLGAREATAVVWADNPKPNPRLDNRLKDVEQKLDLPPLQPGTAQFRRLGRELYRQLARHGAADVSAHGRESRRRTRARRRASCRSAAAADDDGTRARARAARRRHGARQERRGARGGRERRRDRWAHRRRHARNRGAAAGAGRGKARSGFCANGFHQRPERCCRATESNGGGGRLFGDVARWRHRLRQDRGLFRGGGGRDPPRPPKPHSHA